MHLEIKTLNEIDDRIKELNLKVEETVSTVFTNLKLIEGRTFNLNELKRSCDNLQRGASEFQINTQKIKSKMANKAQFKLKQIILSLIIVLLTFCLGFLLFSSLKSQAENRYS